MPAVSVKGLPLLLRQQSRVLPECACYLYSSPHSEVAKAPEHCIATLER